MKKIDIYIIKKFLGTFFYAIALLSIIIVIFDISEKVDDFIEREAPISEIIFSYYANFLPFFINLFSPLFTFIAVIFFTSKLARNTEIIAILSNGISFWRFLRPYMISAVFIAFLSFYLTNFLIPKTNVNLRDFEVKYLKSNQLLKDQNIHMQVRPGMFYYVENYNNLTNIGRKFSIENFTDGILDYKLIADKIVWDSLTNRWKIVNYYIRTIDGKNETITKGKEIDTSLSLVPKDFTIDVDDIKTMDYFQLRTFFNKEKLRGAENVKFFEVEKYKRVSFPFATIILTIIGVSLSSRKTRGGVGMHLGLGIAISFAFILFMQISTVFATAGNLSPLIAVWIPNILFFILGLFLLKMAPK
ncbi:MAG: LptF/LptG family permease [Bacteroidales bacterium]|nr:LptF/LptG family permease [Bacteroidales bacterium]